MTTNFSNFKPGIDLPQWRPLAPSPSGATAGVALIGDLRRDEDTHPEIFQLAANAVLNAYHIKNDGWAFVGSPSLAGTYGAGAGGVYAPSHGARGSIAAGATTSTFTPTASIGSAVGVNQLADRRDSRGFKVRVIDNGVGGSGKIEERLIVANSASSTPIIRLDSPLSFTPVTGSSFEVLSGRAYLLGAGTNAAGIFKWWDPALNIFSGNLANTGLPTAISTDSSFVALDELHVPHTQRPGEGFLVGTATYNGGLLRCLTATAASATTITGQSSGGDSAVLANEYRNFQIRIVEDTINPTAVGQRRKITSHTAGASAIYTVPTWTTTPSSNCKFVIENANELLLFTSAVTSTYTYAAYAISGGQSADTWSTTTYGARGTAVGGGVCSFQAFGMLLDPDKNCRYSQIYSFRGGSSSALDILDIAGGANGAWSNTVGYGAIGTAFTTATSCAYDPFGIAPTLSETSDGRGRFAYIQLNGTSGFYRFNAYSRTMAQWTQLQFPQGTASAGQKITTTGFVDRDGGARVSRVITIRQVSVEMFDVLIQH